MRTDTLHQACAPIAAAALAIGLSALAAPALADAKSYDGTYHGSVRCSQGGNGQIMLTVADGVASFRRSLHRSMTETGRGTVKPDGSVTLSGRLITNVGTGDSEYKLQLGAASIAGAGIIVPPAGAFGSWATPSQCQLTFAPRSSQLAGGGRDTAGQAALTQQLSALPLGSAGELPAAPVIEKEVQLNKHLDWSKLQQPTAQVPDAASPVAGVVVLPSGAIVRAEPPPFAPMQTAAPTVAAAPLPSVPPSQTASLPPPGALPATEPRLALVVGNGGYKDMPLANPVNDVKLVGATLRRLGFQVQQVTDADQRAMKRAIQEFGERLDRTQGKGVGLFFYAGHGIQASGKNYLIPVGAQIRREADLEIEAVNASWVLNQMEYARAQVNIVILDACRNNPLQRSFRSAAQGLARMDAPRGTIVAYSTAPDQVAADGAGANSPYSAALAQAMLQAGTPVEQMFKQVRRSVLQATSEQQIPWESSSLTGDFFFQPQGTRPGG